MKTPNNILTQWQLYVLENHCHIDSGLVKLYESEVQYWQQVIRRIVSVVKFLRVCGLAFRGKNELTGSSNNGNNLGILKLLRSMTHS